MSLHLDATYDTTVPAAFDTVRELVREWCSDVTDAAAQFGDAYGCNVEEVENESRSGFIPFTDGGFDGIVYATINAAHGSGFVPGPIRPYLDADLRAAEEEWNRENPDCVVSKIYSDDLEEERERWYEFQDEWLREGGTYFYKVRALFFNVDNHRNESGEPEVFFMAGINTDFEYGRDHISWLSAYGGNPQQSQWAWERTVPVSKITPELIEQFTKEASDAIAAL